MEETSSETTVEPIRQSGMLTNKILIAGGGIGGLCAALSFAGQGFDVRVFEQAAEFGGIGAGIQLSPNCTRVLFDLGLEDALQAVSFLPEGGEMRDWRSGKVLGTSVLGDAVLATYGFPYFHIHRADLIDLLVVAARAHPGIQLYADAEVTSVQQGEEVVVTLGDGRRFAGDLLVGADGIRSAVREALFGEAAPTFTGNVAWRALVPVERLPPDLIKPMATVWWGPHKHFVHYYVRRGDLVNCVCVVEKEGWEVESWTEPGEYEELKADFAGWHQDIQLLIDNAEKDSLYKWALFDRAPMSNWSSGRVTLLGDACHPTLPFMAQGAAMAIEDGAVLARCLRTPGEVGQNLQRYEELRRSRTAGVQNGSRRNAKVFHLSGYKAWLRNRAAKHASGNAMKWLFSYNALDQ